MTITLVLRCAECGDQLRTFEVVTGIHTSVALSVPQCSKCRERAVDVAYQEGHDSAVEGHFLN